LGAIDQFRQATALRPEIAAGHENLGRALLDVQRWQEAEQEFRIAEKLAPGVATYNGLGHALAMQGKLDEAIGAFQKALSLDPADLDVRENLRRALELKRSPQQN
jgi:tetratricopeptide (TPR) repeat protein